MYKREKCFIKTKKQHVSFVVGTFLSLQRERIYGLQIAWTSFVLENTKPVVSIVIMTAWTQGAGITYLENVAPRFRISWSRRKPHADEFIIFGRDLKTQCSPSASQVMRKSQVDKGRVRESSADLWMPHAGKGTWVHREALRRPGRDLLFQSRSCFQWPLGEEGKHPQSGYNDLVVSSGTEFLFLGNLKCFPTIVSPTLLSRVTHSSALTSPPSL